MIDTHTHVYLEEFNTDRHEAMQRAINAGLQHLIFPNVDFETFDAMHDLHNQYPKFTSMAMGLHPTSITSDYTSDLQRTIDEIEKGGYVAVGEVGMDLYWDKTFEKQQREILKAQLKIADKLSLPVIIHCRDALKEILEVLDDCKSFMPQLIFHSFTGTAEEVKEIRKHGDVYFGINGIVTFKNAKLDDTVMEIGLNRLLLETDSPYLAPVPKRGRRNESAYLPFIAEKIGDILSVEKEKVDEVTSSNAISLFKLSI